MMTHGEVCFDVLQQEVLSRALKGSEFNVDAGNCPRVRSSKVFESIFVTYDVFHRTFNL